MSACRAGAPTFLPGAEASLSRKQWMELSEHLSFLVTLVWLILYTCNMALFVLRNGVDASLELKTQPDIDGTLSGLI